MIVRTAGTMTPYGAWLRRCRASPAYLCLSRKTVETHRSNIMDKLELHKVTDLVKYAIREGLVGLD